MSLHLLIIISFDQFINDGNADTITIDMYVNHIKCEFKLIVGCTILNMVRGGFVGILERHGCIDICTSSVSCTVNELLNPNILKNYCHVSNWAFVSEMLEKILSARISTYLSDKNLLEPIQSAYRKAYSTDSSPE